MLTKILSKKVVDITTNTITETEVPAVEVEIEFGNRINKGILYFVENQAAVSDYQLDYLLLPVKSNGWYFSELIHMYINLYQIQPLSEPIDEIIYLQKEITQLLDDIDIVTIKNFHRKNILVPNMFYFDIFDQNSDDQETLATDVKCCISPIADGEDVLFSKESLGVIHTISENMKVDYGTLVYCISRAVLEEYHNLIETSKEYLKDGRHKDA